MEVNYLPFTELLDDIVDNRGRTCPTAERGIPLIATNCIKNDLLYPAYEKVRYVSQETYDTWFRGHPKPGDLIFVTKGTPGRTCLVPNPINFCIAQDMVAVRADKTKIYPKYLFAVLRSADIQNQIENMHVGTLIPHFKKGDFDKLFLPVPDRETQETIGDMYFDFSAKIDLNRRMNNTLESMAQAVFHQWFVENEDIENWDVVPLPEIIEVNPTRSLKKGDVAPYLDMANMPTQGHRGIQWIDRSFGSGTKFVNGDTLLARITPCLENGKTAFVDFLKDGQIGWGSTEYIIFHPKPPLPPEYGYYLARSEELRNHAIVNMTGTSGRQRTPASCFNSFLVSIPTVNLAKKFGDFACSVIAKVRANDEESRTLVSLRDSLLPKLMKGQVKVV